MSEEDGTLWREEESEGDMGGENCREGTKVFNDESNPGVVSVDHSGECCECPESASRLGSTSRCQMVNGGRVGTYRCSSGDGITLHILFLRQSTIHPAQIQREVN